ncbi:signal peptide peptidase SppA [Riemerella columbina]|uniref:signal peptide peptidase SppA n=1 Tax=Riemerella columbina TaxID=103810 RepID=UPI00266F8EAC|nr:signal peptide peptidase SppA [Riemerella columbina]WKS94605.1 signal peptide peptidase SppA [Riemerella columbina]
MRDFIKNVLANIVAIGLVIFMFFGFMIFIIMLSTMGSSKESVKVEKNSVLTFDDQLKIIESDTEKEINLFEIRNNTKEAHLFDIIQAIKKAKNDPQIKGISIENDQIIAGITQIENLRTAIDDFKKSGKWVYAYGNTVSQPAYFLGSVADKYILNPAGGIELKGMASEVVFFKDFAEQYGIGLNVIRHGKFKAAVEPFLRNDISPENQEQLSTLLNDVWSRTASQISQSRKIDSADFKTITDSLFAMIPELSLKYKLADQLLQKTEYDNLIKAKLNLKKEDELNKISIRKYIKTIEFNETDNQQIAVLYASGSITDGDDIQGISSKKYIQYIQDLKDDDDIKAVVLRINSPGGSANASDQILYELQQLKQKKPLIVSFGDYAASGGYYIAMAGDRIFSEPNTITGSIGVFSMIPDFKKLANKNGIRSDVVATNANSSMISPINGITEGTKTMLQKQVNQIYKRFVYFVTKNRNKTFEQIDQVGGGRVWSGTRAKEIGLVDALGGLNEAIAYTAEKAQLKNYTITSYPGEISPIEAFFNDFSDDEVSAYFMKKKLGTAEYEMFEAIEKLKIQKGSMMYTPFKIIF